MNNIMRFVLCKKGTSFIEIIIYVAIVGMLITTFITFSLYIHDAYNKSYTVQEVHANARVSLDLISHRIRAATSVNVDDSVFDSDPGVLSLEMNNPLIDPTVFNLDEDDGVLYMTEGVGLPVAITDGWISINNFVFTYLEDRGVESVIMDMNVDHPGDSKGFIYFDEVSAATTLR